MSAGEVAGLAALLVVGCIALIGARARGPHASAGFQQYRAGIAEVRKWIAGLRARRPG